MRVLDAYPWVAECFAGVRESQGGAYCDAACPLRCHERAGLRFWVGRGGNLVFTCWAGCNKREILSAVGKSFKDCFPGRVIPDHCDRQVTHYPYADEAWRVLYRVARFEPGFGGKEKDLRPQHPTPAGWKYGLPKEVRRVLYRLPELLAADPAETVFVVAGEKDAESLRAVGLVATTNVHGESSRWLPEYSEVLAGRYVAVVPDQDSAGLRHADEVVGSLVRHGVASVRVAELPAKDATAFLTELRAAGVTGRAELAAEFWAAVGSAPAWACES